MGRARPALTMEEKQNRWSSLEQPVRKGAMSAEGCGDEERENYLCGDEEREIYLCGAGLPAAIQSVTGSTLKRLLNCQVTTLMHKPRNCYDRHHPPPSLPQAAPSPCMHTPAARDHIITPQALPHFHNGEALLLILTRHLQKIGEQNRKSVNKLKGQSVTRQRTCLSSNDMEPSE